MLSVDKGHCLRALVALLSFVDTVVMFCVHVLPAFSSAAATHIYQQSSPPPTYSFLGTWSAVNNKIFLNLYFAMLMKLIQRLFVSVIRLKLYTYTIVYLCFF